MKKSLCLGLFALVLTSLSWTQTAQAQPTFGGNIGITQRLSAIDAVPVGPGGATNAPVGSTVTWEISVRNGAVAQVGGQPVSIPAVDVQLRELFSGPFTLNPASITSVPAGVTCTPPAVSANITEIFCDIGAMAPNATVTVFMSGTVDGEGQIDKVGTVNDFFPFISDNTTILIPLIDFNPLDNVATASVVAGDGTAPAASLLVSKTVRNLSGGNNTLPVVGETVEYEILVGNLSAVGFAGGVLLTDITMGAIQMAAPPSGPDWFCASLGPNPPTPPTANNFIYCVFLGNIPAGGLAPPLLLQGTVLAEGMINNTVTVQPGGAEDVFFTDNTATVSILAVAAPPPDADLSLSKVVDGPTSVSPGDTVLNRIVVTNPEIFNVTTVVVTDTLSGPHTPGSINFVTVPAGFACADGAAPNQTNVTVITCTGGPVLAGTSSTVIEYEYEVSDFGQNDNLACITAQSVNDTNPTNNCSVASTIAVDAQLPPADLRIRKNVDNVSPVVTDVVTYTIQVRNTGPNAAIGATITDTVFGNITLIDAVPANPAIWDCNVNNGAWQGLSAATTPRRIRCNAVGNLVPGGNQNIVVTGTIDAPGPVTNSVSVAASGTADPNLSDNTAAVTVVATDGPPPSGDLSIDKSIVSPALPYNLGDGPITFQIDVTNNAGPDQTDVVVVDNILGDFNIAEVTGTIAGCTGGLSVIQNTVYCSIAALPAGVTHNITYQLTPLSEHVLHNIATVVAAIDDTDPSNDTVAVNVAVGVNEADLQVTKTVENLTNPGAGSTAEIGDQVRFTIEVENVSANVALGVNISDILSGPIQFDSAVMTTGGTCTPAAGPLGVPLIIDCNPGNTNSIGAGVTAIIQVDGTVLAGGQIDNVASASSNGTADPNTSNNTAVASVITTLPSVDLSLTKTANPTAASIGEVVTFTIVLTNPGPDPVTNVVITDHVSGPITQPTNFNFPALCSSAPAPANPGAWIVTCNSPPAGIPVGNTTITYEGTVTDLGQIDNIATITSLDAIDSNLSNNSAVASVNGLSQEIDLAVTKEVDNPSASIGDSVVFTIRVVNNGVSPANAVRLTDTVNGPFTYVSDSAGCNVDQSNPAVTVLTCDLGTINPGDPEVVVTVTGDVADLGQIDNHASVADLGTAPPTVDIDLSNNNAIASVIGNSQEADLSVIKEAENLTNPGAGTSGAIGDTIRFTSTIDNNGPASIQIGDAQFSEVVSGPFTVTTVTPPAGGTCNPPVVVGNVTTVTCTNTAVFNSGGMSQVIVEGTIDGISAISNTVAVGGANTSDPNQTNNVATADVNGTPVASDLSVFKEVDISNGTSIGDLVTFTITVTNSGGTATNVVVTDQVIAPNGVFTITDISSTLGDICTPDAPGDVPAPVILSCVIGSMDDNDTEVITVIGRIDGLGQIENTAVVTDTADPQTGTPASTDPNVSNNVSVASTVGVPTFVDLSINKDVLINGNTPVNFEATPLDTVDFVINVTNNGSNDAQGVVISDVLTGSYQINNITMSDGGSCAPSNGASPPVFVTLCTPDNGTPGVIGAGQTVTITMTGQVTATGQVDNTASVSSSITADPILANNTAVASVIGVPTPVDLMITKTVDDPQATSGETVTFTVRVENNDPIGQTALGVMVTDLMTGPINVTAIAVTAGSGTCQPTPTLPAVAQPFLSIVCIPDDGEILTGEAFEFTVAGEITGEGQVDNVASVDNVPAASLDGTITEDPNTSNNTAVASVIGDLRADLRVLKDVVTALPVSVGDTVTYMIEVFNDGPNLATGVVVTDLNLGPFTAFANISAPAVCTLIDDNNMNCTLPDIPSMSSVSFTYDVVPTQPGFWFNIATVSSTVFDPILANNTISANLPVEVTELADLEIVKTADVDEVKAGDEVNYTLTVTNNGPQDATNIIVSDFTAGPFDSIINVATDMGACNAPDQGLFTCTLGSLGVGQVMTITYTLITDMPGTLSDLATVGGEVLDPIPENNADAYQVKVLARQADLEIHKQVSPNPVAQTTEVTYTLTVKNNGPDVAENVWVIDEISGGFESVVASASNGGACTETPTSDTTSTVKCELGDLDVDEEVTITITVTANGEVRSVLSNLASVSSDTEDPLLANNTTSADTLTIEPPPPAPSDVIIEGGGGSGGNSGCSLHRGDQAPKAVWLLWCLAAALTLGLFYRSRLRATSRL